MLFGATRQGSVDLGLLVPEKMGVNRRGDPGIAPFMGMEPGSGHVLKLAKNLA
jgi:hypothetical protein